jgi:small subunit ribosomal protein S19e
MASINDVQAGKLIEEAAIELQKMPEMAPPSWSIAVKTGISKERPPTQENWWYLRSAAVLRAIYKLGPIGVSKLRTKYGGRKNRGYAPDKTFKGSGNILRKILQKLEIIGFAKQTQVGVHKGRIITPKGKSFIDKIATRLEKTAEKAEKTAEKAEKAAEKAEKAADKASVKAEKPAIEKEAAGGK